jgi:NADH:ubiquinone oxidoreductase subunit 3 (subunit A)
MSGYLSVVVYLGFIIAFAVVSLGMAWLLSPKRPFPQKLDTYECGAEPLGSAGGQLPVGV